MKGTGISLSSPAICSRRAPQSLQGFRHSSFFSLFYFVPSIPIFFFSIVPGYYHYSALGLVGFDGIGLVAFTFIFFISRSYLLVFERRFSLFLFSPSTSYWVTRLPFRYFAHTTPHTTRDGALYVRWRSQFSVSSTRESLSQKKVRQTRGATKPERPCGWTRRPASATYIDGRLAFFFFL